MKWTRHRTEVGATRFKAMKYQLERQVKELEEQLASSQKTNDENNTQIVDQEMELMSQQETIDKLLQEHTSGKEAGISDQMSQKTTATEEKDSMTLEIVASQNNQSNREPVSNALEFNGGLYRLSDNSILVSVPEQMTTTQCIHLERCPLKPQYVKHFGSNNVLSNIITLRPHQSSFEKHVAIRFPYRACSLMPGDTTDLWFSDSETDQEHHWMKIKPHQTVHQDDIFWFTDSQHCYVFLQHFCHIILIKGKEDTRTLELIASLHCKWVEEATEKVHLVLGFHCWKCKNIDLKSTHDLGIFLDSKNKGFYDNSGPVTAKAMVIGNKWQALTSSKNMEVDDLFAQCNSYQEATERPGVYTEKFIFLSADKISGPEESELYGKVSIVQENRTETVIDFTISKQKCLEHQAKWGERSIKSEAVGYSNSSPIDQENVRTSVEENPSLQGQSTSKMTSGGKQNNVEKVPCKCETAPISLQSVSDQTIDDNTTKNRQYPIVELPVDDSSLATDMCTSTNALQKHQIAECVFSRSVKHEQHALCQMLDIEYKTSLPAIARAIGDDKGQLSQNNLSGFLIIQVWNMFVQSGRHTWKELYEIFRCQGCRNAAQQLKVVYEKDKLVKELKYLSEFLRPQEFVTDLLSKDVIDLPERRRIMNEVDDTKAVHYLVLDVLIPRDYIYVENFHKVLYNTYHKDWVTKAVLCPEDFESPKANLAMPIETEV